MGNARLIDIKDARLNCVIDGAEGKPWITFFTGIANDHTLWDAQIPALAPHYRILRIDSRGHGLSTSSPHPYTLRQLVGDVLGIWDALDIRQSAIAGLGLGGIVVSELALQNGGRVSALIPVSCRASMTPQYQGIWPGLVETATKGGIAAIADMTISRWFSQEFRDKNPATMKTVRDAILRTSLDGYLGCIAAILTLGHADRLSTLRMPVLYISGQHDRVGAPPDIMQVMCDATPGAKHVVLPGATHISTVCNPTVFNAALLDFLRGIR
ncbi:MAG: alpha/beta fold hydrolase [Betaproteobacteria bacterium]|nr:alpha/beta fold hydrolase [Betaproteobacteria bacterium]